MKARLTPDDVRQALDVLEALAADHGLLALLPEEERTRLRQAAGTVFLPDAKARRRLSKEAARRRKADAIARDEAVLSQTGIRALRRQTAFTTPNIYPPKRLAGPPTTTEETQHCYVCHVPYTVIHHFYDQLCPACGDFNFAKRTETADLAGRVALVTGGRVKIGYQAVIKLLRAGAHVIVTTRFPIDAADRYTKEPDYAAFRERLQIHGLDLRHTPSVELFTRFLLGRLARLDYILNNACQTVRRPAGFFQHLRAREATSFGALPPQLQSPLAGHHELNRALAGDAGALALSQRRYLDEDYREGETLFPAGRYDEDLQQIDLREMNSWRLRLHEVETPELLEVQLVNAIAPYVLNARLKALMVHTAGAHKHIVNVSAMEGQFYRTTKTDKHPHTNMAKAALNMMTRTSAPDYVKDGIHMNAVDTGWITDEDPAVHAARKAELGFAPPLDIIDGAARIVDPIFSGQLTGTHVWGQFLKDYKPAPW
jgi:NAD(P)-dependent dehydrogenase (short-subunit alcohol dehydrogenase family)